MSHTYRLPLSKLKAAQRALGAATATEGIERALDLTVFSTRARGRNTRDARCRDLVSRPQTVSPATRKYVLDTPRSSSMRFATRWQTRPCSDFIGHSRHSSTLACRRPGASSRGDARARPQGARTQCPRRESEPAGRLRPAPRPGTVRAISRRRWHERTGSRPAACRSLSRTISCWHCRVVKAGYVLVTGTSVTSNPSGDMCRSSTSRRGLPGSGSNLC